VFFISKFSVVMTFGNKEARQHSTQIGFSFHFFGNFHLFSDHTVTLHTNFIFIYFHNFFSFFLFFFTLNYKVLILFLLKLYTFTIFIKSIANNSSHFSFYILMLFESMKFIRLFYPYFIRK